MVDERFEKGIRLFNEEEFFDAHEVWEEAWQEYRGDDRTFLQALIQIAAGFYHVQCENPRGAKSQLSKGLVKLEAYPEVHRSIHSMELVAAVRDWLQSYETDQTKTRTTSRFPRIVRTT